MFDLHIYKNCAAPLLHLCVQALPLSALQSVHLAFWILPQIGWTGNIAFNLLALLELVQTKETTRKCKHRGCIPMFSNVFHRFVAPGMGYEWTWEAKSKPSQRNMSVFVRGPSLPTLANADWPCNSMTFHIKRFQKSLQCLWLSSFFGCATVVFKMTLEIFWNCAVQPGHSSSWPAEALHHRPQCWPVSF